MPTFITAAVLLAFVPVLAEADRPGPAETVEKFINALSSQDYAFIRAVFTEDSVTTAILPDDKLSSASSAEDLIKRLSASKERSLERIWDAKVLEHGSMATVWTPYDFYRGGKFSHCGINDFTLVRVDGKWKIRNIVFTVERTGCPTSPLGPPKG